MTKVWYLVTIILKIIFLSFGTTLPHYNGTHTNLLYGLIEKLDLKFPFTDNYRVSNSGINDSYHVQRIKH